MCVVEAHSAFSSKIFIVQIAANMVLVVMVLLAMNKVIMVIMILVFIVLHVRIQANVVQAGQPSW